MDSSVVEEWLRKVISNAPYDEMSATAASVLAKYLVDIDRPYEAIGAYSELAQKYPEYGFEIHKGYGTKAHYEALRTYGPCPIHRKTFLKKFYGEK